MASSLLRWAEQLPVHSQIMSLYLVVLRLDFVICCGLPMVDVKRKDAIELFSILQISYGSHNITLCHIVKYPITIGMPEPNGIMGTTYWNVHLLN